VVHTALSSVFKGEKEVRDAVLFVRDTMFLRASVFYIIRSWPPTFQLLLMCDNRRTRIRQRAVTSWIWMRWTNHGEGARSLVSKDAHIVRACENAECLVSWRQFLADISCRHAYRAWDQCSSEAAEPWEQCYAAKIEVYQSIPPLCRTANLSFMINLSKLFFFRTGYICNPDDYWILLSEKNKA